MLIQTREQFLAVLTTLRQAKVIACDTETTGFYWHQTDQIIGISFCCSIPGQDTYRLAVYLPFRHSPPTQMELFDSSENLPIEWLQELKPILERKSVTLVFHNFKFDAKFLRKENIFINDETLVYDTMVMAHMINENGTHKLKGLAEEKWGAAMRDEETFVKKLIKKNGGWDKISPSQMSPYAVQDAEMTYDLFYEYLDELHSQDLMPLWKSQEEKFLHCLLELEWEGIALDNQMASDQAAKAQTRMQELVDEMGFDPSKLDDLADKLFGSPPGGLGLPVVSLNKPSTRFPNGRPVMDEEVLSKFDLPLPRNVLEYRGLVKANSTWWKGFPAKADQTGRIHTSFNSSADESKKKYGTVTGRLSSSGPNLQQMPRDPATPVKKLLMPPERFRMYEFDYSQIELRLAAVYSSDSVYLAAFRNGDDPHQITADLIGVDRHTAKTSSYAILYGGAAPTLKSSLERYTFLETGKVIDFPLSRAQEILKDYYEIHPNLKTITKTCETSAKANGYIRLWSGRRRHFNEHETFKDPSGNMKTVGGYPYARKAFNSLLQGGCAEIIKHTMLRFYDLRGVKPYRMVLQVHDSLWFEVPNDFREDYLKEIQDIMEWPGQDFGIPFPCDCKLIRRNPKEDYYESELSLV